MHVMYAELRWAVLSTTEHVLICGERHTLPGTPGTLTLAHDATYCLLYVITDRHAVMGRAKHKLASEGCFLQGFNNIGDVSALAQCIFKQCVSVASIHYVQVYLTSAFRLAIFLVPNAKQVVITAGKPSGMAATANATAILK